MAATLADHLPEQASLLITTVTPTGQERARARFPKETVTYLPFDFAWTVRGFFHHFDPGILVLIEGDYWPGLLRRAAKRAVPVVVINGRVSDRSFRRLRPLKPWLSPLFSPVSSFGMQTDADRDRLVALGVPASRIEVTGNLKFDSPEPPLSAALQGLLKKAGGGRPILIAGSTMRGEEEIVLEAYDRLRATHDALLVLAPRHPERWSTVADLLSNRGRAWGRRSNLDETDQRPDVLLLDTLGELAGLYRLGSSAFIGGTIVPTGGHNPLEAARFGVPVAVGPSMENFAEIADAFDEADAWQRVTDAEDLAGCWSRWIADPADAERVGGLGADLVSRHRGAVERSLELLAPHLESAEHPE